MIDYIKPTVVVYDVLEVQALQAQARSCSGGAIGTNCKTSEVAKPDNCTGSGTVGTNIGDDSNDGDGNDGGGNDSGDNEWCSGKAYCVSQSTS